jgi:hypothetical protein
MNGDNNMCLELTYTNSKYSGLVFFSYLAVDDKIIINHSTLEERDGEEFVQTHAGPFDSHVWIQWCASDDKPIMTALLSYKDEDMWEGSLCHALTTLHNHQHHKELASNLNEMLYTAVNNGGFFDTYIGDMLANASQNTVTVRSRTVDFQMLEPTLEDVHPQYDT